MERKIHQLARQTINLLNENWANTTWLSNYSPKLSLQLPTEYYERLVTNNDIDSMTIIRLISFGPVKRFANLSVDELQKLRVNSIGLLWHTNNKKGSRSIPDKEEKLCWHKF